MRLILSAGSKLEANVQQFLRTVYGVPFLQGYGMTESGGGSTVSTIDDQSVGHVGVPSDSAEIKLVARPDLGFPFDYSNQETREKGYAGEVYIRGPAVTKGYFLNGEATGKTIDKDGWLHTGDMGLVNTMNNNLNILDRISSGFKLSQGEFVLPERVESVCVPNVGLLNVYL